MFRSSATSGQFTALILAGFTFACSAGVAVARPTPSPTPVPTATPSIPPEDPAIARIARHEFVAWQAGNIDRTRYTTDLAAKATDSVVTELSAKLSALGAFVRSEYLGPIRTEGTPPGVRAFMYHMVCTKGEVYEQLVVDGQNRVAGIIFRDKLPT